MKILITGGSGHLGREVIRLAATRQHNIRVLSRHAHPTTDGLEWVQGDIASGEGVPEAVAGVEAIVHLASDPHHATVDVAGTRRLVEAALEAQLNHLVYISIVGIDAIPLGYYKNKLEAEKIIESSGVPYSMLRATQFHSLLDSMLTAAARFPVVMPLPTNFRFQGVAEAEVAECLIQCLATGPQGRLPDLGGPEVQSLGEVAQIWKEVKGVQKKLVHLPLPGPIAVAFRSGKNTVSVGEKGSIGWYKWLMQAKPL